MRKTFFLFSFLIYFFLFNAHSVLESEIDTILDFDPKNHNESKKTFFKSFFFTGENNFTIHFLKFGFKRGKKGSLLIAPGRGEAALKYLEVAYDFIQKGFSPVFVLDHRGQGYSDRALTDPHKGHVIDFRFYSLDFNQFIEKTLQDNEIDTESLFLISHSMGGTIVIDYLQNFGNSHPFKKVIAVSPMIKIHFDFSENFVRTFTSLICGFPFLKYITKLECDSYIPGSHEYDFKKNRFKNNTLTSSRNRFLFTQRLWKINPALTLGSPTMRWVLESIKATRKIRSLEAIKKIEPTPFLILQASGDTVVENKAQNEFCQPLSSCQLIAIEGSKHEILMEKDRFRNQALEIIFSFMED